MSKIKLSNKVFLIIWSAVFAVILGLVIAVNCVAAYWGDALEGALGSVGTDNFRSFYKSKYDSDEELVKAQQNFVLQTCEEGAVLLKNESKALPLASGNKVSVFGHGSVEWVSGGKGSGAVATDKSLSVKSALSDAGFTVNEKLWEFTREKASMSKYKRGTGTGAGDGNDAGDWRIGEIPQSEYTTDVKSTYSDYSDAAIIVIGRVGGEGSDLPKDMARNNDVSGNTDTHYEEGVHYLELDKYEKELLKAVKDANVFKKIIVIINSANAMELGFLDEAQYGIDGCLWLAGTGNNGISALGTILGGSVSPSGKLVDTWAYDEFSAPSMQNHGDYRYVNSAGELQEYSYMVYAESIYMGYRYYETRYEDKMLSKANVGDYDYASTVQYPFGYGLSYTDFVWSGFSVSEPDENGDMTVKVTVTNNGEKAGKDVVEIYAQSPYTEYDVKNKVEKSSVVLVGFAKTGTLEENGGNEEVTVTVNLSQLASYDAKGAKTYLLEKSDDYYLTAAYDSHAAVNNILAAKGVTSLVASPAEETAGNAELVKKLSVESETKYNTAKTGAAVTNLFDYADMTNTESYAYDSGFAYLSRNNWNVMDDNGIRYATGKQSDVKDANVSDDNNRSVYTVTASGALLTALKTNSWEASGNPKAASEYSSVTTGKDNGLTLDDFYGTGYDETVTLNGIEYSWDDLIDQMSASDLHNLFRKAGYCTQPINSVGKRKEFDYDGPAGISNYLAGTSTFGYASEVVLASTWNEELAYELGKFIGEDGLKSKTTGWYAPAMNIHRTPFSGRNYEYYSEDPYLSGIFGTNTVIGAQEMGMYCDMKHFAGNDQETNRSAVGCAAIWASEQTLREICLKPFQMTVENGDCHGCMTTMNRIGHLQNFGSYPLISGLLRGEWGFNGVVITDYSDIKSDFADQILAAGGDLILNTGGTKLTEYSSDRALSELRRVAHNVFFTVANSNAMGEFIGGVSSSTVPLYVVILIVLDVAVAIGIGVGLFFVIRRVLKNRKNR